MMLKLTKDGEYAVRAVMYLSRQPSGKISLITDISNAESLPRSYLSKIMQSLARAGIVRSRRGPSGGFTLCRDASLITLRETIEAVEGPIILNDCLSDEACCPRQPQCLVQGVWEEAQKRLLEVLNNKTMAELAKGEPEPLPGRPQREFRTDEQKRIKAA